MSKQTDIEDLIGELEPSKKSTPVAKPAPAKKAAPVEAVAKTVKPVEAKGTHATKNTKPVTKATKAAVTPVVKASKVAAPTGLAVTAATPKKGFLVFAEGEREGLVKAIKRTVRKSTNTRLLAEKLSVESRKLRRVLYGMEKAGQIKLVPGTSRKHGMFVEPMPKAA